MGFDNTAVCLHVFSQPSRGREAMQEKSCLCQSEMQWTA